MAEPVLLMVNSTSPVTRHLPVTETLDLSQPSVGVTEGVTVAVLVSVAVGVSLAVAVKVAVAVGVLVWVAVGVAVWVAVTVKVAVTAGVLDGTGVFVGAEQVASARGRL
jgi:hypothetical protein